MCVLFSSLYLSWNKFLAFTGDTHLFLVRDCRVFFFRFLLLLFKVSLSLKISKYQKYCISNYSLGFPWLKAHNLITIERFFKIIYVMEEAFT